MLHSTAPPLIFVIEGSLLHSGDLAVNLRPQTTARLICGTFFKQEV